MLTRFARQHKFKMRKVHDLIHDSVYAGEFIIKETAEMESAMKKMLALMIEWEDRCGRKFPITADLLIRTDSARLKLPMIFDIWYGFETNGVFYLDGVRQSRLPDATTWIVSYLRLFNLVELVSDKALICRVKVVLVPPGVMEPICNSLITARLPIRRVRPRSSVNIANLLL